MYSLHRDVYFQNFGLSCVKYFENLKSQSLYWALQKKREKKGLLRAVQTSGSNRPSVCLYACLVAYLRQRRRRVQQNQFSIVFIHTHTHEYAFGLSVCVYCVDMKGEGKKRKGGAAGMINLLSGQFHCSNSGNSSSRTSRDSFKLCLVFHSTWWMRFSLSPFFLLFSLFTELITAAAAAAVCVSRPQRSAFLTWRPTGLEST